MRSSLDFDNHSKTKLILPEIGVYSNRPTMSPEYNSLINLEKSRAQSPAVHTYSPSGPITKSANNSKLDFSGDEKLKIFELKYLAKLSDLQKKVKHLENCNIENKFEDL